MPGPLVTVGETRAFIESVFGASRASSNGLNVAVRCPRPECDSSRDPRKLKLVIRVTDHLLHCWVCGFKARSLLPLLLRHGTRDAVATYRERFLAGRLIDVPLDEQRTPVRLPDDFRLLATASGTDKTAQRALRYVRARGFAERELWRLRPGVSDDPTWHDRVLMPSFDATGELTFFTGRAFSPGMIGYNNCDADKNSVVFNEINVDWKSRLVLCEGPFDLAKCGDNAVPLLGSSLAEDSALMDSLLAHATPVALALDADMRQRTQTLGRRLSEYGLDVLVVDLRGHHDPGEMTRQEFAACLTEARPWSWHGMFTARLDRATHTSARI